MALTRSVLPRSLRFLANHSSPELFQLTVLAFCLVSAWISGYLVSSHYMAHFVTMFSMRCLAKHSSIELFQLTVLAFCLVSAWISGYLVPDTFVICS